MGDVARAAGVGPEVSYKGTVYPFKPVDALMIGRFEVRLERRAFEAALRQQSWMRPGDYADLMAGVRRDCAADVYSFGGEYFGRASLGIPGLKYATYLSLKAASDGRPLRDDAPLITEELASEMFDAQQEQVVNALYAIGWLVKVTVPEAPGVTTQ